MKKNEKEKKQNLIIFTNNRGIDNNLKNEDNLFRIK